MYDFLLRLNESFINPIHCGILLPLVRTSNVFIKSIELLVLCLSHDQVFRHAFLNRGSNKPQLSNCGQKTIWRLHKPTSAAAFSSNLVPRRIYRFKVSLHLCPVCFIIKCSGTFFLAAVVTNPALKLCPETQNALSSSK
jgi:hypothetical protein